MRFIILLGLLSSLLSAEPREALLIGNHKYQYISNLDNPMHNLKRLKKSLEDVGFKVEIETNLNSENLENAIEKFKNRLAKNSNTIGFLYYTGHGCQVDYQGYLVPTNVDTQKRLKIKYNALNINQMLEKLKEARNKVNLLFLDACRDVPTGAKGGTKGLGQPLEKPIGTMLVYATEAGKVANDNAKFINALIENINKPNQYIKDIGDNISRVVAKKSSYKQIPEVYSKLLPQIVLKGGYVPPPLPPPPSKWITPKDSVCRANGGKIDKDDGVCEAPWKEAKQICSASGGRLPTIDELKRVVTDCGGEMEKDNGAEWQRNKNNSNYENCYKEKGFASYYYWSSATHANGSGNAWIVDFNGGYQYNDGKNYNRYVRCVRAGE